MASTFLFLDAEGFVRIHRVEMDFKNPPNSGSGPYKYPPTMAFLNWIQASEHRFLLPSWEVFQVIKENAAQNTHYQRLLEKKEPRRHKLRRRKK